MKILHTSDWHIGQCLYGRKRYEEFEKFLAWLAKTIQEQKVEALLVAGDVFDSTTPSNRAQELYYRFLCRVANSSCRHVVITAGNHDSPTFLNAPRELLKALNVHVIGAITENLEDEILVLNDESGAPGMIVCAVPYLRDRDVRVAEAGEQFEDKQRKLIEGIIKHYADVAALAEQMRKDLDAQVPIVAMGHLFTAGGQTMDGDGVRELYVGSLARVTASNFPDCLAYMALGHLHVPQIVNGSEVMRYSGSPLPIGFGESRQKKQVCLVDFAGCETRVQLIVVPVFQNLEQIKGDMEGILRCLRKSKDEGSRAWLEVIYDGCEVIGDLRERLNEVIAGTEMEILRVKNNQVISQALGQISDEEELANIDMYEVFQRLLERSAIPVEQHERLKSAYGEIVRFIHEEDTQAE